MGPTTAAHLACTSVEKTVELTAIVSVNKTVGEMGPVMDILMAAQRVASMEELMV